jgi:hypothetical protein
MMHDALVAGDPEIKTEHTVDRHSKRHILLATQIGLGLVSAAPTFPTAVAACVLAGVATVLFLTTGRAAACLAAVVVGRWPSGQRELLRNVVTCQG